MKKSKKIILILLMIVALFSCKENEFTVEKKINEKLLEIEKKIEKGDFKQENFIDPFEEIHMNFLFSLSSLTQLTEFSAFQEESNLLISSYDQMVLKSGNTDYKEKRALSNTEELIFKSYIRALRSNKLLDKIRIAEHYIYEIQNLYHIPIESKNYISYAIGFHRSLMIFVDIANTEETLNEKSVSHINWAPCANRNCFDCCMFRWTQSMDDWNTVEWIQFFANPAANTAWKAGSCANDCFFRTK